MNLNIEIGPYIVSQRTEYSKLQLFDKYTGKNITDGNEHILEKIVEDYMKQTENVNDYFTIKDGVVELSIIAKNSLDYLFLPNYIILLKEYSLNNGKFKYIKLPDTLKEIAAGAFCDCKNLVSVNIPDSVTIMGNNVFEGCKSLEYLHIPKIEKIPQKLCFGCKSLKEVNIPETANYINNQAFEGCEALKSIYIPEKVVGLGHRTFAGCKSLKDVKLSYGLKSLGKYCFSKCGFKEIDIPETVKQIGMAAFENCKKLEYAKFPEGLTLLDHGLFMGCSKLKNFIVPDSICTFSSRIFSNTVFPIGKICKEDPIIENINIPRDLTDVVDFPFENSNVKSLTFNYDLKKISNIYTTVELPSSEMDLIGNSQIEKLIIKSTVKTITPEAFKYSGAQIKEIDYLGTKEDFQIFKNDNKQLFEYLFNVKEVNTISDKEINESIIIDDIR